MQQEKWNEIKDKIRNQFEIIEEKKETLKLKTNVDKEQKIGDKDIIIFISPIGKVKLEYIVKPVILEKKEHYSKRAGITSRTEYK
ncbi:MAG: hypothetical protein ACTSRA_20770, partial [Promethearchaeota archaeon]